MLLWHNQEEKGTSQLFAAPLGFLLQARYSSDEEPGRSSVGFVLELVEAVGETSPCKKSWPYVFLSSVLLSVVFLGRF